MIPDVNVYLQQVSYPPKRFVTQICCLQTYPRPLGFEDYSQTAIPAAAVQSPHLFSPAPSSPRQAALQKKQAAAAAGRAAAGGKAPSGGRSLSLSNLFTAGRCFVNRLY